MTSRENSEAWEFDKLSEGSKRIIEQYTKVWYKKSTKVPMVEVWENLENMRRLGNVDHLRDDSAAWQVFF